MLDIKSKYAVDTKPINGAIETFTIDIKMVSHTSFENR